MIPLDGSAELGYFDEHSLQTNNHLRADQTLNCVTSSEERLLHTDDAHLLYILSKILSQPRRYDTTSNDAKHVDLRWFVVAVLFV